MNLKLHPDATVEKNPSNGDYVIHNAGFRQDITSDQLKALPDAKFTELPNGDVRVEHDLFGAWHWAKNHFAALFKDADAEDSAPADKSAEEPPALVSAKTPEEIEAEQKANADEANSLLGNSGGSTAESAEVASAIPTASTSQPASAESANTAGSPADTENVYGPPAQ